LSRAVDLSLQGNRGFSELSARFFFLALVFIIFNRFSTKAMAAIHLSVVPPPLPRELVCTTRFRQTYLSSVGFYHLLMVFKTEKFRSGTFFFDRKALVERKLFPVGPAYLAHVRRKVHDLTFEAHDEHEEERNRLAGGSSSDEIIDDLGVGDEEEDEDLLSLDPKEWKVRRSKAPNGTCAFSFSPAS
jgi:hypothetical protein